MYFYKFYLFFEITLYRTWANFEWIVISFFLFVFIAYKIFKCQWRHHWILTQIERKRK